jgi:5-methylcytosine-specific restriction endonuclease McrA
MRSSITDLTGQRFSRLIAIEVNPERSKETGRTHWVCQCDCGNISVVRGDFLRTGNTKSCGCLQRERCILSGEKNWFSNFNGRAENTLKDLTGQRFDMLLVIGFDCKKNGISFWNCICDCGNAVSLRTSYLKSKYKDRCCGCLCKGRGMPTKGNRHWNWKGGISSENRNIRNSLDYRLWRTSIFERDNYTCQECGAYGGKLNAHHIKSFADFPEERFNMDNGITLCDDCHEKTENYRGKANRRILA